jgi:uncharacterized protein
MGRLTEIFVAERTWDRLVGLTGMPTIPAGAGLLIPRCRSVHTFGMRFPLDVLFVTIEYRSLVVHDARYGVPPWRVVRASRAARGRRGLAALELAAGTSIARSRESSAVMIRPVCLLLGSDA